MACCRPTYKLPTFNTTMGVWRQTTPRTNPPDAVVACCLSLGERVNLAPPNLLTSAVPIGGMWVQCPKATVIFDGASSAGMDVLEIPPGSGCFYTANWTDRAAFGFPNEHRFIYAQKMIPHPGTGFGPPPPPPPPPPPVVPSFFHLTDGQTPAGAPQTNLVYGITVPQAGWVLVRAFAVGAGVMGTFRCTINAVMQGPEAVLSVNRVGFGMQTTCASFLFNIPVAGGYTVTLADSLGGPYFFFGQTYFSNKASVTKTVAATANGGGAPISIATGGAAVINAPVIASAGILGDAASGGWVAPAMLASPMLSIVVAGNTYVLTTSITAPGAPGAVTAATAGGANGGWGALTAQYV